MSAMARGCDERHGSSARKDAHRWRLASASLWSSPSRYEPAHQTAITLHSKLSQGNLCPPVCQNRGSDVLYIYLSMIEVEVCTDIDGCIKR